MNVLAFLKSSPDDEDTRIHVYPGLESAGADALCRRARELVERGPAFSEHERRGLADAWPALATQPLTDHWSAVLAQECHKQYRQARAALTVSVYAGPTPFDTRIAETEAELATVAAAELMARGKLQEAGDDIRADMLRRRTDQPSRGLVEQRQEALAAHVEAEQHFTRLRSRLTALEVSRSRWRAEQG